MRLLVANRGEVALRVSRGIRVVAEASAPPTAYERCLAAATRNGVDDVTDPAETRRGVRQPVGGRA